MSSLYKQMVGTPPIIQQFNEFRNSFTGDAKAEVERLVNSGQISQQQLNEAQNQARQLMHMLQSFR